MEETFIGPFSVKPDYSDRLIVAGPGVVDYLSQFGFYHDETSGFYKVDY